eukprot:540958-Prymnesium_polylepis.1
MIQLAPRAIVGQRAAIRAANRPPCIVLSNRGGFAALVRPPRPTRRRSPRSSPLPCAPRSAGCKSPRGLRRTGAGNQETTRDRCCRRELDALEVGGAGEIYRAAERDHVDVYKG